MQLSGVRTTSATLMVLGLALAWVVPIQAGTPEYVVHVLPSVVNDVEQRVVFVADINNLGQVAGHTWFDAFRYTADVGMDVIDLGENSFPAARRINDRGDVLGTDVLDWFLWGDGFGVDPLERGLSAKRREGLFIMDLNNHGDLVGGTRARDRFIPLLYSRDDGWQKLAGLDPRFKEPTVAKWINDAGDIVFTISRPPRPGDDPPFGGQQSFVLRGGETLVELDDFGSGVNVPGDLNESGELAGIFIDRAGREQAYVFRPELGVGKVTAGEFREAMGGWITDDGVVGGMAAKKGRMDTLFSIETRGNGASNVVKRRKFRKLARANGSRKLTSISIEHMNDRVEFVGNVKAGSPRQFIPYFYARGKGLHTIQSIVDAAGVDLEVDSVVDINDRGQILVSVERRDGTSTGAILTPVN